MNLASPLRMLGQPQPNHFDRLLIDTAHSNGILNAIATALSPKDRGSLRQTSRDMRATLTMSTQLTLCINQVVSQRENTINVFNNASITSISPANPSRNQRKLHHVDFSVKDHSNTEIYQLHISCYGDSPEEAMSIAQASLRAHFYSACALSQRKKALLEACTHTNSDSTIARLHDLNNFNEDGIIRFVDTLSLAVEGGISAKITQLENDDTFERRDADDSDVVMSLRTGTRRVAGYVHNINSNPAHAIQEETTRLAAALQGRDFQEDQALVDEANRNLKHLFWRQTDPVYLSRLLEQETTRLASLGIDLNADAYSYLLPESVNEFSEFREIITEAQQDIEDNPQEFQVNELMQSVSGGFGINMGDYIPDIANQKLEDVQSLLSGGADPRETDQFGRNAYHYITHTGPLGNSDYWSKSIQPMMLDALRNADPNFSQNIMHMDDMRETPLDWLMEAHKQNAFLTRSQLQALLHAQIKNRIV